MRLSRPSECCDGSFFLRKSLQNRQKFLTVIKWISKIITIIIILNFFFQGTGISEEVFRQIETVQNRYDSSTAAAFRAVQKSGEMVVRTLDPRQFIRLASETAPKINIDTNVSTHSFNKTPL